LAAQTSQQRARIVGGGSGNQGKCTVEVVVDGVAEVEVRGDDATLRTLSGRPAQWRRFECTGRMPSNPSGFRFNGVDGRGRQSLVRDPSRGGAAVVRIEDSQGGAEGYTFDLFWSGGAYTSGPPYGGRYPQYGDRPVSSNSRAIQNCQTAVEDRMRRQGNSRVQFDSINVDDRPGRNDWVVGTVRNGRGDAFNFSCSVNIGNGSVRSVDVNRR
jgi:hypothetical protein